MKIAFILDCFPTLSETYILNQITHLIDLGHNVTIFAGSRPHERCYHQDVTRYNLQDVTYYHNDRPRLRLLRYLEFIWLFALYIFKAPVQILRSLNFFKYGREAISLSYFYKTILFVSTGPFDILQCHFGHNGNLGAVLKEIGIKGKLVTMFHGYDIRAGIAQGGQIYSALFKNADAILSISDYNQGHLVRFGAPVEKIKYIPVGIDLGSFPFKDIHIHREDEKVRMITVARLVEIKGLKFALEALNKLVNHYKITNIEYQIVGDGPLKNHLMELTDQLAISQYVHFFGSQEQKGVSVLLQKADFFLLPSLEEALPMTLMEAQAVGLPVIASQVGSVHEIVAHNESGYLIPRGDSEKLTEKIYTLIQNHGQWQKMGIKGRRNVESKYDIKKITKNLEELYLGLTNDKKPEET